MILGIKDSKGVIYDVLVDECDLERIKGLNLKIYHGRLGHDYVVFADGKATQYLHRFLLGANGRKVQVDHVNGNGLDNRRANIRLCSAHQNLSNWKPSKKKLYSKYAGVYRQKGKSQFFVIMQFNYKRIYLGRFSNEIDAAKAYDKKALELRGEFARLNFPKAG